MGARNPQDGEDPTQLDRPLTAREARQADRIETRRQRIREQRQKARQEQKEQLRQETAESSDIVTDPSEVVIEQEGGEFVARPSEAAVERAREQRRQEQEEQLRENFAEDSDVVTNPGEVVVEEQDGEFIAQPSETALERAREQRRQEQKEQLRQDAAESSDIVDDPSQVVVEEQNGEFTARPSQDVIDRVARERAREDVTQDIISEVDGVDDPSLVETSVRDGEVVGELTERGRLEASGVDVEDTGVQPSATGEQLSVGEAREIANGFAPDRSVVTSLRDIDVSELPPSTAEDVVRQLSRERNDTIKVSRTGRTVDAEGGPLSFSEAADRFVVQPGSNALVTGDATEARIAASLGGGAQFDPTISEPDRNVLADFGGSTSPGQLEIPSSVSTTQLREDVASQSDAVDPGDVDVSRQGDQIVAEAEPTTTQQQSGDGTVDDNIGEARTGAVEDLNSQVSGQPFDQEDIALNVTEGASLSPSGEQTVERLQETASVSLDTEQATETATRTTNDVLGGGSRLEAVGVPDFVSDITADEQQPDRQVAARAETGENSLDQAIANAEDSLGFDLPGSGEGDSPDIVQGAEAGLREAAETQRQGDGLLPSGDQAEQTIRSRLVDQPADAPPIIQGTDQDTVAGFARRGAETLNPGQLVLGVGELVETAGETGFDALTGSGRDATTGARVTVDEQLESDIQSSRDVTTQLVEGTQEGIENRPEQTLGSAVFEVGAALGGAGAGSAAVAGARQTGRAARRASLDLDEFRAANRGQPGRDRARTDGGEVTITREAEAEATTDPLDKLPPREAFDSLEEFQTARLRRRAEAKLNERVPEGQSAREFIPDEAFVDEVNRRAAQIQLDNAAPAGQSAREVLDSETFAQEVERIRKQRFAFDSSPDSSAQRAANEGAEQEAVAAGAVAGGGAGAESASATAQTPESVTAAENVGAAAGAGAGGLAGEAGEPVAETGGTVPAGGVAEEVEETFSTTGQAPGFDTPTVETTATDTVTGTPFDTPTVETTATDTITDTPFDTPTVTRTKTETVQDTDETTRAVPRLRTAEQTRQRPRLEGEELNQEEEETGRLLDPLAGVNETEFAFDPPTVGDEDGDGVIEPPVDPDSVVGGER
jgi:hypothetical protein